MLFLYPIQYLILVPCQLCNTIYATSNSQNLTPCAFHFYSTFIRKKKHNEEVYFVADIYTGWSASNTCNHDSYTECQYPMIVSSFSVLQLRLSGQRPQNSNKAGKDFTGNTGPHNAPLSTVNQTITFVLHSSEDPLEYQMRSSLSWNLSLLYSVPPGYLRSLTHYFTVSYSLNILLFGTT